MHRFIIFFAFLPACIPIQPVIDKYNMMRTEQTQKHRNMVSEAEKKQQETLEELHNAYKQAYFEMDENGRVKNPICQVPKFIEILTECQAQKANFDCMSALSRTYIEMLQERYSKATRITTRVVAVGLSGDLVQLETDLAKEHNIQVAWEEKQTLKKSNDIFNEYLAKILNLHKEIMMSIEQMESAEIEDIRQQNASAAKAVSDGLNQASEAMRQRREQQQQRNINIYDSNSGQTRYCTQNGNNVFCY